MRIEIADAPLDLGEGILHIRGVILLDEEMLRACLPRLRKNGGKIHRAVTDGSENGLQLDVPLLIPFGLDAVILEVNATNASAQALDRLANVHAAVLQPVGIQREVDIGCILNDIIKHGQLILYPAFGSGLTWGAALIRI